MFNLENTASYLDLSPLDPMSPVELAFQYIYEHNLPYLNAEQIPEVQQFLGDDPAAQHILTNICNNLQKDSLLKSTTFFDADVSVLVQTHLRYHPPTMHSHDFYEIQYLLKGSLQQTIRGTDITLHAGDFCFITPYVEHALGICDRNTILVNLLIKREAFANALLNLLSFSNLISDYFMNSLYLEESIPFLINHSGSDSIILYQVLHMLATERNVGPYVQHLKELKFGELFFTILQEHPHDFEADTQPSRTNQKVLDILNYIQQNYTTVTLSSLADYFGYNSTYLSRMLQKHTHRSFTEMIHELRFNKALELIRSSEKSIEEIILEVGYTDRTYFYREFKRRFHSTPAEWRHGKYIY